MIGLPSLHALDRSQGPRIWLAAVATDMRCSFDRLAERVKSVIGQDPSGNSLFVFRPRRGDRLKCLPFKANKRAPLGTNKPTPSLIRRTSPRPPSYTLSLAISGLSKNTGKPATTPNQTFAAGKNKKRRRTVHSAMRMLWVVHMMLAITRKRRNLVTTQPKIPP
jgi:hypothetical protein